MNKDHYTEDRNDHKMKITRKLITYLVCMIFILSIFQNVSAVDRIYTIEDNNSNVIINTGEKFNISLMVRYSTGYTWDIRSSNSSVLRLVDEGVWVANPGTPGISGIGNWTFEGRTKGTTTLTFVEWRSWEGNDSIINTFTLNVTSNVNDSTNILWPIVLIVTIIIVVSAIVLIKRMKGGKNDDKKLS